MPTHSVDNTTLNYLSHVGTRATIREQLVKNFLAENSGTGKGNLASTYIYYVELLRDGNRIFLKRPAILNFGFDFTVHVENINFASLGRRRDNPKHDDICLDLRHKKADSARSYAILRDIIDRIYNCDVFQLQTLYNLNFNAGYPTDMIVFCIKWLFFEQDITYWNYSGRNMLYDKICSL